MFRMIKIEGTKFDKALKSPYTALERLIIFSMVDAKYFFDLSTFHTKIDPFRNSSPKGKNK